MPLLSDAAIASARAALGVLLTHTYTRTVMVPGVVDDAWGERDATDGAVTIGVPCRYEAVQRPVRDAGGFALVSVPTLAVAADDPLTVGNRVSGITGSDGVVLINGPFQVERLLDDTAGLGAALQPTWELRGARTVS